MYPLQALLDAEHMEQRPKNVGERSKGGLKHAQAEVFALPNIVMMYFHSETFSLIPSWLVFCR